MKAWGGRGSRRAAVRVNNNFQRRAYGPSGGRSAWMDVRCGIFLWLMSVPAISVAEESEFVISDSMIRDSAQRILSDPTFKGFDHFGDAQFDPSAAMQAPNESAADATDQPVVEPSTPKTWWERLRQNQKSKNGKPGDGKGASDSSPGAGGAPDPTGEQSSSSDGSQGSNPSGNPATESATGESPGERGTTGPRTSDNGRASPGGEPSNAGPAADASTPTPNDKPTRSSADAGSRPERAASKTTPRGAPSLRGRDGVERPVRFAPKPPEPPTPRGPEWNFDLGLGDFFSGLGQLLGSLFHLIAYTALAIVAGLIVVLVARAVTELMKSRRGRGLTNPVSAVPLADDRSPGEVAADVYLQQALALAQAGRFREAVGQLVLGAMSSIERAQWIRYRRGLTLHDYLRSVRSRPPQYGGLQVVVQQYEPIEYGRRQATETTFNTALDGYRKGFGELR